MPLDFLIRDGRQDDAVTLAYIHTESRITAMPWLAVVHSLQETERWMADVVLANQRVRVAFRQGSVVGFTAFTEGWLEQLYIRPGFQRQGVGSSLFQDACALAVGEFRLWVFQRNTAARSFYERHGCRLVKMTDGRENEEREPDALYEKSIARHSP
jgi:ribosomal protein S18 acetylase RimI-like enzyme